MIRYFTTTLLLLTTFMVFGNTSVSPTIELQYVVESDDTDDDNNKDEPGKGHRMPPTPVFCELNFE